MEAWTRLCGAIFDVDLDVDCLPIIDWLRVSLTHNTVNNKLPLPMLQPTAPLANGDLLYHKNHMLARHLPGLYPALQRFQGLLVANHIREVSLEMRRDREVNVLARQVDKENRIPDLLGSNLTYLFRLGQVADH